MKRFVKLGALLLIMSFAVTLFAVPALAQPLPNDPLSYYLTYDEDQNKLHFTVANLKSYPVNLRFSSGQDFDLIIRQKGQKVWQYSDDKSYTQAVRNERLQPYNAKSYQVELPLLADGNYQVQAYFAGGVSRNRVAANLSITIKHKQQGNIQGLKYDLDYNAKDGEMVFTVTNKTYQPINLIYPQAKKFDLLILNNNGKKVWRHSDDMVYTQALQREWLYPWRSLVFEAKLPALKPGNYTVQASFHAAGVDKVVASRKITIENKKNYPGLEYGAWYSGGSQPHITFAVKNNTKRDITVIFPTGQKYDIVVKGNNGYYWRFSDDKLFGIDKHSETIKAGVNRFNFLYLPKLPHGKYTATVYYLGVSATSPVATCSFTVN